MIEQIQAKISADEFEYTRHATDQSILRQITVQDLRDAIEKGEIIEDYPDDKSGRPLHVQCSHPSRPIIKVITLYEPDPTLWVDYKIRRE